MSLLVALQVGRGLDARRREEGETDDVGERAGAAQVARGADHDPVARGLRQKRGAVAVASGRPAIGQWRIRHRKGVHADRCGKPASSCCLAWSETWTKLRG